jgi:prepilin-type N-terminal cleavage/methylation domain-containing protein
MARHRTYIKSENGFTLIETIVALAIMAMIIVAFFIAMSTSGKALLIAQERTTAESIARSVMESVKQMEYYSEDGSYTYVSEEDTSEYLIQHPQFSIWSVSVWDENGNTFVEGVVAVNWDTDNNSPAATDNGLQRIEVLIKNGDREVYTLEDYKADR